MECYTISGTFCDTWLFRKASSKTKFPHPESGNRTTGSQSFTTNCNFRSPALWQGQIQVSAPWRIHCALLWEKFWRAMPPKLGEFPKAVSLWQPRAWGAACTTRKGEQCDRSDALDTVMDPVWKPGEWCHSKTFTHRVQWTNKPSLHSEEHSHSYVHSCLWNWTKDSLSNDRKKKKNNWEKLQQNILANMGYITCKINTKPFCRSAAVIIFNLAREHSLPSFLSPPSLNAFSIVMANF